MSWRALVVSVSVITLASCTERLTTPGGCPTFCPGGASVFRDTILTPTANGDSSFTGFVDGRSLASVLVSSGGGYGQNRAVIRFLPRGDTVIVADSGRSFTVDSVTIELGLQSRDTTVSNFVLEIYRLPLSIDTTSSFAAVDAAMTPANLIAEVPEPVTTRTAVFHVTFSGDSLSKLAFVPADSTRLQIGLRVRADGPTAARFGTPGSSTYAPLVTTYVHAIGVTDSLASTNIARAASQYFTASASGFTGTSSTQLAVGGLPVSRSFLRFTLPAYLKDSVTIVRATLSLHGSTTVFGIPGDTTLVVVGTALTDFGAKSPIAPGAIGFATLRSGQTDVDVEVTPVIQFWQGANGLPPILRLALADEGSTFLFPIFYSTRAPVGTPTLRITYRPPITFSGY